MDFTCEPSFLTKDNLLEITSYFQNAGNPFDAELLEKKNAWGYRKRSFIFHGTPAVLSAVSTIVSDVNKIQIMGSR